MFCEYIKNAVRQWDVVYPTFAGGFLDLPGNEKGRIFWMVAHQYPLGLYGSRVNAGSVRSTTVAVVGAVKAKLVRLRPALA
jgi:hypothetical protein